MSTILQVVQMTRTRLGPPQLGRRRSSKSTMRVLASLPVWLKKRPRKNWVRVSSCFKYYYIIFSYTHAMLQNARRKLGVLLSMGFSVATSKLGPRAIGPSTSLSALPHVAKSKLVGFGDIKTLKTVLPPQTWKHMQSNALELTQSTQLSIKQHLEPRMAQSSHLLHELAKPQYHIAIVHIQQMKQGSCFILLISKICFQLFTTEPILSGGVPRVTDQWTLSGTGNFFSWWRQVAPVHLFQPLRLWREILKLRSWSVASELIKF